MRNIQELSLPSPGEVKRLEVAYRGLPDMKELYQREADVLHDLKEFDHDLVRNYKLRNFTNVHRGFKRIAGELGFNEVRVAGWRERVGRFISGKKSEAIGNCGRILPHGMLRMEVVEYADESKTVVKAVHDFGLISVNLVTTAFVNYLTDTLHAVGDISLFKYHGSGTGTTAEATGDTALVTEVESRVTGNQTEGASANIYHTEAQLPYTASRSITEHGVFSASSAGTLMDRSVFTAIAVDTTTEVLFKYELTSNAGG